MKAILACDQYGGIGKSGKLPWKSLDGDMQRFIKLTQGCTIVMGHNTWVSLPKRPLPNRKNIVVTQQAILIEGATVVNTINDLAQLTDTWFIGGANLLKQVWPMITEFHLTRANDIYDCDTFINLLYLEQNFNRTHQNMFANNSYEIWIRK